MCVIFVVYCCLLNSPSLHRMLRAQETENRKNNNMFYIPRPQTLKVLGLHFSLLQPLVGHSCTHQSACQVEDFDLTKSPLPVLVEILAPVPVDHLRAYVQTSFRTPHPASPPLVKVPVLPPIVEEEPLLSHGTTLGWSIALASPFSTLPPPPPRTVCSPHRSRNRVCSTYPRDFYSLGTRRLRPPLRLAEVQA